jgi:hypothetical protein
MDADSAKINTVRRRALCDWAQALAGAVVASDRRRRTPFAIDAGGGRRAAGCRSAGAFGSRAADHAVGVPVWLRQVATITRYRTGYPPAYCAAVPGATAVVTTPLITSGAS